MNLTTANIIDLSVLAFILLNVIIGAIRGAFKSVIGLVVFAASIFAGYYFSPMLTPKGVDWLYPKISDKFVGIASEKLGMAADLISEESLANTIKPVLEKPVRIFLWVVISLVALLILDIIARIINKAIKNSDSIKGANRTVGALIGLVISVAVCFGIVLATSTMGLSDFMEEKTDGAISYQLFEGFVPENVKNENKVIDLPIIGEVNISELLLKNKAE